MGFQRRIGPIEAVWVADELLETYARKGVPLMAALLDVRKAYDNADRELIWRELESRGAEATIVSNMQSLFDVFAVVLLVDGRAQEPIPMAIGVAQGVVNAPDLFNLLVNPLHERLRAIAGPDCPVLVKIRIPIISFADDQTLFCRADRPAVMQAMLDECHKYSIEYHYRYNVNKCVLSVPKHPALPPLPTLTLGGEPIADGEDRAVKLLGVCMKNGRIDHAAQLRTRTAKARSTLFALSQSGCFKTKHLNVSKKRVVFMSFVRSQLEYGLCIANHSSSTLKEIDSWVMRTCAEFLGGHRNGSILMMRYAGIVPMAIRQAQLRGGFLLHLKEKADEYPRTMSGKIAKAMFANPASRLSTIVQKCPVWSRVQALMRQQARVKDLREWKIRHGTRLEEADKNEGGPGDALVQALQERAWRPWSRAKLMRVQKQEWNRPHATAFQATADAYRIANWLTNRLPGIPVPCQNCNGAYETNRYHCTICVGAQQRLEHVYRPEVHLKWLTDADNAIDACLLQLTRPSIIQAPAYDGRPRKQASEAAYRLDERTRPVATAIATVLKDIDELCRPRQGRDGGDDNGGDNGDDNGGDDGDGGGEDGPVELRIQDGNGDDDGSNGNGDDDGSNGNGDDQGSNGNGGDQGSNGKRYERRPPIWIRVP
ncbi:hypothetical protein PBRA_009663 [Plasmodiophora brassicae]|uniref:Reverse transcriptase domain-containing protein n=1 Tax=Plasmodiophora brassicae TaxID=37360 RepID=A0A0G4IJH9_PLABS|nr:hypothetical protein PBRA_009663 [Plasmodiophora brassicae]